MVVTPAQVHLRLLEMMQISGKTERDLDEEEVIAYLWGQLMLQFEQQRKRGVISFEGYSRNLLSLQELRDMCVEFGKLRPNVQSSARLDDLAMWLHKMINELVCYRGLKVGKYERRQNSHYT